MATIAEILDGHVTLEGFLECADPQALQKICDSLGPQQVEAFLARWLERLPMPLTREDRAAGYTWQLSIWQMEVSLTQVFDRPVRGREFSRKFCAITWIWGARTVCSWSSTGGLCLGLRGLSELA